MIELPIEFSTWIRNTRGGAGALWLDSLPDRIDLLRDLWRIEPDGPPWHGGMGIALPVVRDGQQLVLKLSVPDETVDIDVRALTHWNGRGTVLLFDSDIGRGAMLLERLGPRHLDELQWGAGIEICAELIREMSIPAVPGIPRVSDVSTHMAEIVPFRWQRLDRPFPQSLVDRTIAIVEDQSGDMDSRMVNKDLHFLNVLAGTRQPWLAIDPKPLIGAPEFGVAQILWRVLDDLDSPADLKTCFEIVALDPAKLRDWTFARIVDYWLWALDVGLTEDPRRCKILIEWMEN
jgi:streptomycin 6-kinase